MEEIGNGLSLIAVFGFVAFLIWHGDRAKEEKRRRRSEERKMIFDRIGSGEALTSFLQTEEGRRLLDETDVPEKVVRGLGGLRGSVLGLLTAGIIATITSGGFFYATSQGFQELVIPGAIIGSIGLGCIAAALLHYIFGKVWGSLDPDKENGSSRKRLE
jgi:hypothetical protein